jgi:two-component system, cell cycle sensor histidine kinase and response regulator CckA
VHLVGLAVVIVATLAIAATGYFNWNEYERGIPQAQQARRVAIQTARLLSDLKDAETAERGYLLTGDESYLEPYQAALPRIQTILRQFRDPGFHPIDTGALAKLQALVSMKLDEMAMSIEARRTSGSQKALEIVRTGQGEETMDAIRELSGKLTAAEQSRLAQRSASVAKRNALTRNLLTWGSAGIILILALFGFSVHRLIRGREDVIRDLDAARNESERARHALDTTLRSLGEAVISTDTAGRITFMNPVAERLTGWKSAEAEGREFSQVFRIEDESTRSPIATPLTAVQANGLQNNQGKPAVLIARSGQECPIDYSAAPILDKAGSAAGVVLVFRDITERYRTRKQLEVSERKYRVMFENNPQPAWVYDTETLGFLAVNNAALNHYGYSREDYAKMTLRDIRPAEDIPQMLEDVRRPPRLHTDGPWRHRKKDGSIISVELSVHPLEFDGRPARMVLINDITSRLAAEESLLETLDLLKTIVDTAPVAIWTLDLDGRVTSWNQTATELFQWTGEEVMGKPLPVIPADQRAEFTSLLARYRQGFRTSGLETVRVRKDGEQLPVSLWAAPLSDKQGHYTGILGIVADLSQRKRDERTLAETEAGFRLLFESNPQPMWVFHAETLQFLEVNRAAIAHHEYSRDEILNMRISDVVRTEDVPQFLDSIGQGKAPLRNIGIWKHRLKGGRTAEIEVVIHRLEFKGTQAILAVLKDVTDQRKLEEQLRQSQKLEAVGRLAGGVAHDFNNLLTVITGYAEFLHQSRRDSKPDRDAIEEVLRASERAGSLTQQLLAFSRRQIMQPKALNLNESVLKIKGMLSRLIGEDIELLTELDPNLWQVSADPGQIDQIIMNLAVNSRDAMESGGSLTIHTSNVTLDDSDSAAYLDVGPGQYAVLSISDTGHGMDVQTRARIFEPFFTTKEAGRGTGLGMSTVYGIVKQTGGGIYVYSEIGKGTRVAIYLPRLAADVQEALPSQADAPQTGTETILIVEDEESVRKLVAVMLERSGYAVVMASGGEEAIRICQDHSVHLDLLITDLILPHIDGQEIARRAREHRPDLKTLFMSGYTEHAILRKGKFDEAAYFIQKPFTRAALTTKVREILGAAPNLQAQASFQ